MMDRDTWLAGILAAIRDLGDAAYQERVWVRAEGPEADSSAEAICRLYDDFDLAGFLAQDRQRRWLAADEHAALQAFETALGDYIATDDDATSDATRVTTPEWHALCKFARRTLEVFETPRAVSAR
jgi:hypothetical protein